jgi:hypothetical protein
MRLISPFTKSVKIKWIAKFAEKSVYFNNNLNFNENTISWYNSATSNEVMERGLGEI